MTALPPPPRPASPDDALTRPPCTCCHGKRSLKLAALGPFYVCPLCDYAKNARMAGCFGPLHPG